MNRIKNIFILSTVFLLTANLLTAQVFNNNLTDEEKQSLQSGTVLIKNINFQKNMCLNPSFSGTAESLVNEIKKLSPKYLAEVIQIRPYEDNEDLPQKLETILNNVPDYAGIPYYSERHDTYWPLYDSATIVETTENGNLKTIRADLEMEPFGTVDELIEIQKIEDSILYVATNQNKLNYLGKFDCVWPQKMKICIFLIRDGENWILYGIGGVNAPRIPFFTERIETSFINRIKTFCNFIFSKI
ncbi:MAG: hypothetical protein K6A43_01180 [Treponema sp.]|nr:hypothetical protein [Treponema sp.]